MMTPINPTATAPRRQGPTFSPRTGIASRVMNNGATKKTAIASARLITAKAVKYVRFEITISIPRRACSNGVAVRRILKPPSNCTSTRENTMPIAERTKTSSCRGYSPDRRLISMSLIEIASMATRMKAIPAAGRCCGAFNEDISTDCQAPMGDARPYATQAVRYRALFFCSRIVRSGLEWTSRSLPGCCCAVRWPTHPLHV